MLQGLGGLYIAWSRRVKNSSSHFPSCNSMIYGAPGPTKSQVAQVQFTCCSWHPAMCFWAWRSWAFQSSHGAAGPKRVAGKEAKGLVKGKWLIGKPDIQGLSEDRELYLHYVAILIWNMENDWSSHWSTFFSTLIDRFLWGWTKNRMMEQFPIWMYLINPYNCWHHAVVHFCGKNQSVDPVQTNMGAQLFSPPRSTSKRSGKATEFCWSQVVWKSKSSVGFAKQLL